MDKYLPTPERRKQIVLTQIDECQVLIYRNNLEDLTFKQKNDEDKQTEVETNNNILKRKLDLLFKELDDLNETSGDSAQSGAAV